MSDPLNSLLLLVICAWTSNPITLSNLEKKKKQDTSGQTSIFLGHWIHFLEITPCHCLDTLGRTFTQKIINFGPIVSEKKRLDRQGSNYGPICKKR